MGMRRDAHVIVLGVLISFSSAVMSQEADTKLPYGLSCSRCMIDERSTCAALPKAELVIDARQMEPIDERRECEAAGPIETVDANLEPVSPNAERSSANASSRASTETCHVVTGARFASVFVLRSPRPTVSTKIFLTNYTIDDASPALVEGVRLLPDTRYILFTKKATWNAPFKAEWQVMGACRVPTKPVMAGKSD